MTPPDLELLADYDSHWEAYEEALYGIFIEEIAHGNLQLAGLPIRCRRIPESFGRWAAFWHLIQEGKVEEERLPDLRRCERLRWVRWVIENADSNAEISQWKNLRGTEKNLLLWFREEYLVVLSVRTDYLLLKSAYCTTKEHRIASLRRERDACLRHGR